ncbi:type VI secretion system tip protein TssI/VgrG [Halodesulfovibrio sp.]|uniref:type VI secretion system Vgr family protein n=1 Tax=Halodesulfovibrio sp. TaxID=1912772 RepID=UPI0025C5C02F|nr:type VI secretion system tip protein TssI/VgrG [Halodesulfovibrio sp.]
MTAHRDLHFTFKANGLSETIFNVLHFSGTETLSEPYVFTIELESAKKDIHPKFLVDNTASFYIMHNEKILREFHGIISSFTRGDTGHHQTLYTVQLVPPLMRSSLRQNSRMFQKENAQEIITQLLGELGTLDNNFDLKRTPSPREYCVQYRETDLEFIERIAAEEGILYYFVNEKGKHTLHFVDKVYATPILKEKIEYNTLTGGMAPTTYINSFTRSSKMRQTTVTLKDYSFKNPAHKFLQEANGLHMEYQRGGYEHYDYPGRYKADTEGCAFTANRIDHLRSDAITASGSGNVPNMACGLRFTLSEHPEKECNREWLAVSVSHFGKQSKPSEDGATTYSNNFSLVPSNVSWKPKPNPKPRVDGPQVAVVTGPNDEEIYCDSYGRVKVQFKWDRYNQADQDSSCWIRVSQGWAGRGYGMLAIPRIGHEVIVSFLEGDPDQPIITGRTYNASNIVPYKLPANKTRTVLRTDTHKGRGANEVRFEDEATKEEIYIHAEKDMNVVVEHDRTDHIKNDSHIFIENDSFKQVDNNCHLTIGGESRTQISDQHSVFVDDSSHIKTGKNHVIQAGTEIHLNAGQKIVAEAGAELTLAVGGSFVKIDGGGVHIVGSKINMNSGGSAGNGSGFAGVRPVEPVIPDTSK